MYNLYIHLIQLYIWFRKNSFNKASFSEKSKQSKESEKTKKKQFLTDVFFNAAVIAVLALFEAIICHLAPNQN